MKQDRRAFLGGLAATGAVLSAKDLLAGSGERSLEAIGVQLYTVRQEMATDFEGTLARVAALGYKEVEFAGYFDRSPASVREILARHGLRSPSAHVDLAAFTDRLEQTIEASHTIGHELVVMPWLDEATRAQPGIDARVAETLNRAGERAREAGIRVAYHNHNFEFVPSDGKTRFDRLMAAFDAQLVGVELDVCWAVAAGQDPVALFDRYPGRFPAVHVKGLTKVPPDGPRADIAKVIPDLCEVGATGDVVDWKAVFGHRSVAGIRHCFVEHDAPRVAIESLGRSIAYLRSLRF
jgi:sugar phosphate isomerase/epimerase